MSFKPTFYLEPDMTDVGAASVQQEAPQSIAALMAKHGVKNETENMVVTPISFNTETKEEPKPQEATNAASANEPLNAVQDNSETPSPTVEVPKVVEPAIQAQPTVQPSWQEVLKNQQPDTVLKELGYDEKVVSLSKTLKDSPQMMALFDQWINKGDLTPYLKAVTTDFTKMSPEALMRHQLLEEYPNVPEATINALYKRRVVQAYNLDSELLLEADSLKVREGLISKQSQFLTPKPPEPKTETPTVDTVAIQKQKDFEDFKNSVTGSTLTRDLMSTKQISVGEGTDKFNYPVAAPDRVVNLLFDNNAWAEKLFTKEIRHDGSTSYVPNIQKQLLIATILDDTEGFFSNYAKHFKTLGSKEVITPIENASANSNNNSVSAVKASYTSVAQQMAAEGRMT